MSLLKSELLEALMTDAETVCNRLDLSFLNAKTIMVTGASGLLGTHFLASLWKYASRKNNIETIAICRSSPPEHIKALLDYGSSRILCGDLSDNGFLKSLPEADVIVHAAGYGQPGRFMENPVNTIMINTAGTIGLLEKLRPGGKFLFSSTSEVYSGLPTPPYKESQIGTTNTTHLRSCYIEAKRCGEAICNAYRVKGVQAKSARICLAYGPGIHPGDRRALNSFIEKALTRKEISMLDRGLAMRTYCYVSDTVYMLWRILLEGTEPVYNVGGSSRVTIGELAEKIGKITRVPVRMPKSEKTALQDAPDDVWLDMSKFENEFHPMTFIQLDEGILRTINWLEKCLRLPK